MLSVFNAMLPGTLVLVLGFFCILHSWLNAFAEMLKFADRMFYKVYFLNLILHAWAAQGGNMYKDVDWYKRLISYLALNQSEL